MSHCLVPWMRCAHNDGKLFEKYCILHQPVVVDTVSKDDKTPI